ncbi:hypothetical protein GJ699_15965 [Duganella sp. FT80W]|uniref:Uncharacterized protein n=1 Tax=Duganella guangzhouensis TaxID=2666084 RepID=A0A6I2L5E1_9BURK|nr:hypothetical protein [Duganella guangzhouensis]MRW91489.1 hypothetical protein [Duganella guangzhouensis]
MMRIHAVNLLIALLIAGLLTFGLVSIDSNAMKGTIGVGAFAFLASTLALAIGVSFEGGRVGVNVRMLSLLFFAGDLVLNLIFAYAAFAQSTYVVCCGILFLLYVLLAQALYTARQ